MTATEGMKVLRKLLGPKAGWRESKSRTSPEDRAAAQERSRLLNAEYDAVKAERDARRRELLSDPVYQDLAKRTGDLELRRNAAQAESFRHRLTVGINEGWCFMVRAEGDNWADVIRTLEAKSAIALPGREDQTV